MSVTIHESEAPATERQLAEVEKKIGRRLPPDYRAFLLEHNGGYPEPDGFPIPGLGAGADGMVDRFLAVYEGDEDNLLEYVETYRGRVPEGFLPVAHDPGGNLICLALAGAEAGRVFFWDHEEEAEEGEPPTRENVYEIAASFTEFLNGLRDSG